MSSQFISGCIKDEQSNIVAMTEGVRYKGKHFHQTILCKNKEIKCWYIFAPKVTLQSDYKLNSFGEMFQSTITSHYGKELQSFKNYYAAYADTSYPVGKNNNLKLWESICAELFPLWEPSSPDNHIKEHNSKIMLFRVYKADAIVDNLIKDRKIRLPALKKRLTHINLKDPVINDREFERQKNTLEKILMKPATRLRKKVK